MRRGGILWFIAKIMGERHDVFRIIASESQLIGLKQIYVLVSFAL